MTPPARDPDPAQPADDGDGLTGAQQALAAIEAHYERQIRERESEHAKQLAQINREYAEKYASQQPPADEGAGNGEQR